MESNRSNSRREFMATGVGAAAWFAMRSAAAAQPGELAGLSVKKASDLLRARGASPVELTEACLRRIERYNPALNAFITITAEQALTDARAMQAEQRAGKWRGPLHGIPVAIKDNMDTAGIRSTGASELFKDRVPSEDAEVVRRLKNAGAVILGKLNLHEFAYGGTSTVTYFGTMHNPWALDRVTGGSSGGPGVAVAADLCFASVGTDTAGSVRMPASHCGIVGLKPTYGRVSTRGVMTLSWTLDHVGPMCKTVEDTALLLNVIAGYDELEPTCEDRPVPDYIRSLRTPTSKLRLGIPRTPFFNNLDSEVAKAIDAALAALRKLTAAATDNVQLPQAVNGAALWGPEAYAYHSRWIVESPQKYQPSTRTSLQRSADSKAWEYAAARRQVDLLRRQVKKVFEKVDVLITPTMKAPPELLGGGGGAAGGNNNAVFDVFGLPSISVPCGFTNSGLPIGLQITGAPWAEPTVLSLAYAYEQATDWHNRHPKVGG